MKKFVCILVFMFFCTSIVWAQDTNLNNSDSSINEVKEANNNSSKNDDGEIKNNDENNGYNENETNNSDDGINLAENAKSAIMIEASTGKIIFDKNSNEKLPMASMTKMMTLLLIMENIENGNLKWDEKVVTSEHAASMGGSQIFLEVGEEMTVEELVKGICIGSGNDAAVSMAERIGGTEEEFVKMMNKKVKELGLHSTNFVNACGLDDENHYSSAYDMAVIARELVKYDKILEFTGTYEDYLRKNSDSPFWLVNTNKLVRYYSGVDGLKTGYTESAGYCITTTAKKNDMRLITVVMGEPSSAIRNSETTNMLDYGFNTYQVDVILNKNKVISKEEVKLGNSISVNIVPKEDVTILNSKTGSRKSATYEVSIDDINAPVKKGDVVGKIKVTLSDKSVINVDATVSNDIEKASIIKVYFRNLLDIVNGDI